MRTCLVLIAATLIAGLNARPHDKLPIPASNDTCVAQEQLQKLIAHASTVTKSHLTTLSKNCKPNEIIVRREWGALSAKERIAYTNAVLCLQSKPAKSPSSWASGAKTRYDDWVATHIDQTQTIHYTGTFLAWHRYFTWEYEQALRSECNYTGTQPYWNWGLTASTGLETSPIFDGSATSMSGNGKYINQSGLNIVLGGNGLPSILLPTGTGGGCITTGPFANMTVNLGPAALSLPNNKTSINPAGPLTPNPRCLTRDLTPAINKRYANSSSITTTILSTHTIYDFQMLMQGIPGSGDIGIHGGGHYSIGGDPGRDVFASPGDPVFYLHHAMIDLVWSVWQALDFEERVHGRNAVAGTGTFLNVPPSANTTLDTLISIGWAGRGKNVTVRDVMSTVDGPFCYVYA